MHINVRDILTEDVGYRRTYMITGEHPSFESVQLTKDIEGEVTISRLEAGLMVQGTVLVGIQLECHRCLSAFSHPVKVSFTQIYAERPAPEHEELPIQDDQIDLVPLLEQEILVSLPIKLLCRPDCPGIQDGPATV